MIKPCSIIIFQLNFFYLVFPALVPLFSPALSHKSRLCHLWWHQKQKTWNLNKGYVTWVDSTLLVFKRKEVSFSKRWVNIIVKKSKSSEKTYIIKGVVFKLSFGLHCFEISVFFTMLLSTCCVFVFVQFVFSIRGSFMDFPLECEFKQTFYWYRSILQLYTFLFLYLHF